MEYYHIFVIVELILDLVIIALVVNNLFKTFKTVKKKALIQFGLVFLMFIFSLFIINFGVAIALSFPTFLLVICDIFFEYILEKDALV